jgi:hypothetical protein
MEPIRIDGLNSAGSKLFSDKESFLEDLSDELTAGTVGGLTPSPLATASPATPQTVAISTAGVASLGAGLAFSYNVGKDIANRENGKK